MEPDSVMAFLSCTGPNTKTCGSPRKDWHSSEEYYQSSSHSESCALNCQPHQEELMLRIAQWVMWLPWVCLS